MRRSEDIPEPTTASILRQAVFDEAIPRSQKIRFGKSNPLHFAKVATYCSVLEQATVVADIINSGLGYHSYSLLRGQMEGLADIINLNKDPAYLKHMEFQYEESFKRQLLAAKNGNPYLREIAQSPDFPANLSRCGTRLKELSKRGARRLEPKAKLHRADLKDEYEALYGHLNDHSHGGIRSLMSRHLREEGEEYVLVSFGHMHPHDFDAPLQTSLDVVLRASVAIHSAFRTGEEKFFEQEICRLSY